MKLMKDTASLVNWMIANPNYVKPEVGMDVTECHWTDRTAWRIIQVDEDGKGFTMQRYDARNHGGIGAQDWDYENEDGTPRLMDITTRVRYKYKKWKHEDSNTDIHLAFNCRDQYHDWSF